MGVHDSSLTRVAPVFDQLLELDRSGRSWIPRLLRLPGLPGGTLSTPDRCGSLRRHHWNRGDCTLKEVQLDPPRALLTHLVSNPAPSIIEGQMTEGTRAKRRALLEGDREVLAEALALLEQTPIRTKVWYVLEGRSQPDAYLETDDCVVVVEGKRTEPEPTTHTMAMAGRHQMLRHIDCAWETRGGRSVFGFFAVSGGTEPEDVLVPDEWAEAAAATIGAAALKTSLPHRTDAERSAIASCFLGVTTWQAIRTEFKLDWDKLPDRVGPGG